MELSYKDKQNDVKECKIFAYCKYFFILFLLRMKYRQHIIMLFASLVTMPNLTNKAATYIPKLNVES